MHRLTRSRAATPVASLALLALAATAACERRAAPDRTAVGRGSDTTLRSTSPPPCTAGSLAVRRLGSDAGAGHRVVQVGLVDTGAAPCTLVGYPVVALLDSAGHAIPALHVEHTIRPYLAAARRPADTARVILEPGTAAEFDVTWTVIEGEPGGCLEGTALEIALSTAPDAPAGRLALPVRACGARVRITALAPASLIPLLGPGPSPDTAS
jgi:hypothetical protein